MSRPSLQSPAGARPGREEQPHLEAEVGAVTVKAPPQHRGLTFPSCAFPPLSSFSILC